MPHKDNIYVGLDIGTTKICTVVARQNAEGGIDVIGLGSAPSTGIRKGVVINIDSTVKAIKDSVAMAERMSGVTIKSVCAGIAGGHIESFNENGVVAVKNGEVTANDVARVIESASAKNIPVGYEVLHILPQQFKLDGQDEIKDPIGMCGVRLEVDVHIVTGAVSSAANITKSCSKAGIAVEDIYLEQLASSEAVLTDEEREIGVCLIDGGGGTTDMAVFNRGACYHTAVLQIGGNNFTRDLTSGLSTSEAEAEEICELFLGEIKNKKLMDMLPAGVVMTGGMSNFKGIEELASHVLGLNVRVGHPVGIGGLSDQVNNPIYATAVGLAKLHAKKGHSQNLISSDYSEDGLFKKVGDRMKDWLKEFF